MDIEQRVQKIEERNAEVKSSKGSPCYWKKEAAAGAAADYFNT